MVHRCLHIGGLHPTWSNLSRRLQPHTPELDSGRRSWRHWQYRARIHHLEIGHSPSQLPLRSYHEKLEDIRIITLLSCVNIFATLSFELLWPLVVPLRHLWRHQYYAVRRPHCTLRTPISPWYWLEMVNWLIDWLIDIMAAVCFYPRDAMLARVIVIARCLSVCPSVCHAPVLCQNEES